MVHLYVKNGHVVWKETWYTFKLRMGMLYGKNSDTPLCQEWARYMERMVVCPYIKSFIMN
jgi:hypothetical protein